MLAFGAKSWGSNPERGITVCPITHHYSLPPFSSLRRKYQTSVGIVSIIYTDMYIHFLSNQSSYFLEVKVNKASVSKNSAEHTIGYEGISFFTLPKYGRSHLSICSKCSLKPENNDMR